jgi:hypothetical protein
MLIFRWVLVIPACLLGLAAVLIPMVLSWGPLLDMVSGVRLTDDVARGPGLADAISVRYDRANLDAAGVIHAAIFCPLIPFSFVVCGALVAPQFGRRLASLGLAGLIVLWLACTSNSDAYPFQWRDCLWLTLYAAGALGGVWVVGRVVARGDYPNQWGDEWLGRLKWKRRGEGNRLSKEVRIIRQR